MTKRTVLLVGSQHGNEHLGEKLYEHFLRVHPEYVQHIEFVVANPRAHEQNIRYLESDMNRSFVENPQTYEECRAQELLEHIQLTQPSFVLDLHTTSANQEPCFIVSSFNKSVVEFMGYSDISIVVAVGRPIAKRSLIGNIPNSLSIEISEEQVNTLTLELLAKTLIRYTSSAPRNVVRSKIVYEVTDMIRADDLCHGMANGKKCRKGYYPILYGEKEYTKNAYYGFKAENKRIIEV